MQYKNNPSDETLAQINAVLAFIRQYAPDLVESEGQTKWTAGHRIFCSHSEQTDDSYHFMIGALSNGKVTWHMMPLYGVPSLRQKYAEVLKPFSAGKSCIHFSRFDDLPRNALEDIVVQGVPLFEQVMQDYRAKRNKRT